MLTAVRPHPSCSLFGNVDEHLRRIIVGLRCPYEKTAANDSSKENNGEKRKPPFVDHRSSLHGNFCVIESPGFYHREKYRCNESGPGEAVDPLRFATTAGSAAPREHILLTTDGVARRQHWL